MKSPKRSGNSSVYIIVLGFITCVVIVAYIGLSTPEDYIGGPFIDSKIGSYIERSGLESQVVGGELLPSWTEDVWTPISIGSGADPKVTLCRLNFRKYWEAPHLSSMFRDLVDHSSCDGGNVKKEYLSVLLQEINDKAGTPEGRVVEPTAFIFHESRVGSTLVANSLASDPWAMTFSESEPMATALNNCHGCSHEEHVQFFRDVARLMGRSPFHRHMFFKFQSATTTSIEIALEVHLCFI